MVRLEWTYLGRVDYSLALRLQAACAERVVQGGPPRLLLLEHPPTITLGRSANSANLRHSLQEYQRRGIELVSVLRGGDVTYHGPGQLVGYPVAHLDQAACSVPQWVHGICAALVGYLRDLGVEARWSDLHPGVWVEQEKIAALGFRISRRVSTHGFALNLNPDLDHFETIVPCGLRDLGTTSLAKLGLGVPITAQAAAAVAERIAERFGWQLGPALDPGMVLGEGADRVARPLVR